MGVIGKSHHCDTPHGEYDKPRKYEPDLQEGDVWECDGCGRRYRLTRVSNSDSPYLKPKRVRSWYFDWSPYKGRVETQT